MNRRCLLSLSLLLNAALTVAALRLALQPASSALPPAPEPAAAIEPLAPPTPAPAPPADTAPPAAAPFHWSRLADDDLKKYRDNLRAAGCPEETVRDIILDEINFRFADRRRAALGPVQDRFWDIAARDGKNAAEGACREAIADLVEQAHALEEDLLGSEPAPDEQKMQDRRRLRLQQTYAWLPEGKRAQLIELDIKFSQKQRQLSDEPTLDGAPMANERLRSEALKKEEDEARRQLLSPDEYDEFKLRASTESRWARSLPEFQPTEAEWRAVTRLQMQFNETQKSVAAEFTGKAADPETGTMVSTELAAKLQNELNRALREALGPERYGAYERAKDPAFAQTRSVVQRCGLSDDLALQAYDIRRIAEAQARQVQENPGFTPEVRTATLAAIRKETENALTQTLGGNVMPTYQEYAGGWLKEMVVQEK